MKRTICFLWLLLFAAAAAGCGEKDSGVLDASYDGFLALPGFETWGGEMYEAVRLGRMNDESLRAEGFDDEEIAAVRSEPPDALIKEMASTLTAAEAGAPVAELMAFRLFTDDFYGESVSLYPYDELEEIGADRMAELGFSEEQIAAFEDWLYVRDHADDISDEELARRGFTREMLETIKNGGDPEGENAAGTDGF